MIVKLRRLLSSILSVGLASGSFCFASVNSVVDNNYPSVEEAEEVACTEPGDNVKSDKLEFKDCNFESSEDVNHLISYIRDGNRVVLNDFQVKKLLEHHQKGLENAKIVLTQTTIDTAVLCTVIRQSNVQKIENIKDRGVFEILRLNVAWSKEDFERAAAKAKKRLWISRFMKSIGYLTATGFLVAAGSDESSDKSNVEQICLYAACGGALSVLVGSVVFTDSVVRLGGGGVKPTHVWLCLLDMLDDAFTLLSLMRK